MENDKLKKYIDTHREEFEYRPEGLDDLWSKVADGLEQRERKHIPLWKKPVWRAAASLLLLLVAAWLLWPKPDAATGPLAEWQEAQQFYQVEITEKLEVLQAKNGGIDPAVAENLAVLDQALLELKADLNDDANNEEVVSAMIKNYQLKLKILEEILQQLQENEQDSTIIENERGA
jgi:hypothetical protein